MESTATVTTNYHKTRRLVLIFAIILIVAIVCIVVPLLVLGVGGSEEVEEFSLVETQFGSIRGLHRNGVRVFHGVPFAQPPIKDLRWRPPQRVKAWHPNILDATKEKEACLQNPGFLKARRKTSESCLYLEIFAPSETNQSSVPVLFHIHGGSYKFFSATDDMYDGTNMVLRTGVIVVSTEYRLGAMGFLVSGDEDNVHGNFGLLDQRLALEWVHENIAAFGGDPNKITLVGHSAGAQSAIHHLLSQESSKYFTSVILESPPVTLPVKTFYQGLNQTKNAAIVAHCYRQDTGQVDMECMRNAHPLVILDAQKKSESPGETLTDMIEPWGPVVDNVIVHEALLDGFENWKTVSHKPILWGVTSEEAMLFVNDYSPIPTGSYVFNYYVDQLSAMIGVRPRSIERLYPLKSKDSRYEISQIITDFIFICPMEWAVQQIHQAQLPPVWTYVFAKTATIPSHSPLSMCSDHACHGIEIPFVFKTFEAFKVSASSTDINISHSLMDYYGNFMWHGNPNGGENNTNHLLYWPRSYGASGDHENRTLVFGKDGRIHIGSGVSKERCEFWYELYP